MARRKEGAFERCVKEVSERGGAYDPRAVCATAGVRKFGQAEMTRRAIAGKKRAARARGNAPRVTQRAVDSAAASYHNLLMAYGENNMATQRAEWAYRDLQRRYAEQKSKPAAQSRSNVRPRGRGARLRRPVIGGPPLGRGRPDYESKLDKLNQQIDSAIRGQRLQRARDLWTKKQKLLAEISGEFRERGNPADAARAVTEEFHGRPVREMKPVTEKRHHHTFLSELGELVYLIILTPDGRRRVTADNFDGALLCSNEEKNQLFIKDGNQSVNLRDFGIKHPHEVEDLGDLLEVAYFTDKHHLGKDGGIADYYHEFSEPLPTVHFYTRDSRLEISGGRYRITGEGIVG